MTDLSGKTVLITGASRGIGEATARVFAAAGANVALLARSRSALIALADEIGDRALPLACDISDPAAIEGAVKAVEDRFGAIDIVINNAAAIDPISRMETADIDAWSKLIDVNIKGVFYMMRHVLAGMKARGGGTVLTISSGAAHSPIEGWSAYCTSKAGAAMLTAMLDHEERENGIRAMGLSPGTVATQMQREIKASGINPVSELEWSDHVPPEWPARALLWMCTGDADAYLGQEISLRDEGIRRKAGLVT
ncbi:SDR family oxidoreductase [Celeribacter arenosi]|uniref:SDR family oxidoreductase n=1 Tax=Celeribacter arenosi TaxID=792649 RepID=A0ABP7JXN6_9RHOB